jgi:acetyl-CoA C-acetyltransferase
MRQVLVAGVGSTRFGRHDGATVESLATEAAAAALVDAAIDRGQVGALYLGNFVAGPLSGQEVLAGLVADELGLGQIPCTKTEGACASGGMAFRHAVLAVASGQCDIALAVGVEKMSHAGTAAVTVALNCAMDNASDGRSGLTFPGFFGMVWNAHAAAYGTDRAMVSAVVRKNKANGLLNPLAQMGAELTDAQIAASAAICDPLQLFDCCPISDGAAAAVVVAADRLGDLPGPAIGVAASVQTRGAPRIAGIDPLTSFRATRDAARIAYETAGLRPEDIDLCELHDCFSVAEIVDSEDLGLVPRGMGGRWALEGHTAVGGRIPINPSGGLLAKGHPVGATGLGQIHEAVLQLRGHHPNQVRDAAVAMTHNLGGAGVACIVNILRRTDA